MAIIGSSWDQSSWTEPAWADGSWEGSEPAVVVEEQKGGRRIKPDEDDGKVYVPLDDRTINELWPPPEIVVAPAPRARAQPSDSVEQPASLSHATLAAILAALDED